MLFQNLCPPAMIYLVFSIVQIVIDIGKGLYNTALAKMIVAAVFATLLNYLCNLGLGVFSWIIVFIPFLFMSVIISVLLYVLGLKPTSGKLKVYRQESKEEDPLKTRGDENDEKKEHIRKARAGKRDLVYEQKQEIISMKKRIRNLEKEKHNSSGDIPLDPNGVHENQALVPYKLVSTDYRGNISASTTTNEINSIDTIGGGFAWTCLTLRRST